MTDQNKSSGWKITAIIFIVLIILENILLISTITYLAKEIAREERVETECLYDICEEYPGGYVEEGICNCYNFNQEGLVEIQYQEPIK